MRTSPPRRTGPTSPASRHTTAPTAAPTQGSGTPGKTAPPLPLKRSTDLAGHLLGAARLPALSDGFTWTVSGTDAQDTAAVGDCQKASLEAIGAVTAVRRTFAPADGSSVGAVQVVARFADRKSAWQAHEVLGAWHEDCAERLAYAREQIGPLREVLVGTGSGQSYRSVLGSGRRDSRATGLGIVRTGEYLSIVEITAAPAAYPQGWDPARAAVRRIARTFA